MNPRVKTSHGIALLGACLLLAVVLINSTNQGLGQLSSFTALVSPRSQLAQVSGAGSGLVGYWTFDGNASDSSGNGNNGTLNGGPAFVGGEVGSGALSFNGSSGYVDLGNPSSLNSLSGPMTVTAWVNMGSQNNLNPIASYTDYINNGVQWGLSIGYNFSNYVPCFLQGTITNCYSGGALTGNTAIQSNRWYHIAAVRTGSTGNWTITFYVNGVLDTTTTTTVDPSGPSSLTYGLAAIGKNWYGGGYYFPGSLDDVRVYNRALSANEIQQLYAMGNTSGGGTQTTTYNIAASAGTGGSISPSGSVSVNSGSNQSFTINSNSGYTWSTLLIDNQSVSTSSNTYTFSNVTANHSISATFTQNQTQVTQASGNIYIAQDASGNDSGSDCNNAHSVSWFNTSSNWTSTVNPNDGKIGPGTTIHLCNKISTALSIQGSGTDVNHQITIKFETGAYMSSQVWNSTGAISGNNVNWITIDGGTNGVIENTDNGTTLGYQNDSKGIGFTGNNITIQNLTIRNMYVRTSTIDPNRFGLGISLDGSNLLVQNNSISGGDTLLAAAYGYAGNYSNITFRGNTLLHTNHAITIGWSNPNINVSNFTISNNHIDQLDWQDDASICNPSCPHHIDGMVIFDESADYSGSMTNLQIYGNTIGPTFSPNNTGAVFIISYTPAQESGYRIFNNIFTATAGEGWSNGFISVQGENGLIANNTFITPSGMSDVKTGLGTYVYNNLATLGGTGIVMNTATPGSPNDSDYNLFNFPVGSKNIMYTFFGSSFSSYSSMDQWETDTKNLFGRSFDTHSVIADPLLVNTVPVSGDYHITSASPAIGAGTNLTSHCSTTPALCQDYEGKQRPSTGPWDIGAYQYSSTPISDTQAPTVPTGLATTSVTSSSVGLSWNASTDNVAVAGYKVYRNGSLLTSVTSGTTYTDSSVSASTAYKYAVSAYDSSNNESVKSSPISVTISAAPASNNPPAPVQTPGGGGGGGSPSAPTISSVITSTSNSGTTITWTTSVPASSQILYGLTSVYGSQSAASTTLVTSHSITLTNLQANTIYHFKIISKDSSNTAILATDLTFTTLQSTATGVNTISLTPVATPSTPTIPANLLAIPFGSRNANVITLQNYLIQYGYLASGLNTGYYGTLTQTAVAKYKSTFANQQTITNSQSPNSQLPAPSFSTFTRTLKLGSTGSDVKALQVFLNNHGFLVSSTGTGSPGHESTYYGPATAAAISRFQLAHYSTILAPNGLTQGTGNFGPATMKVVNSIK